MTASILVAGIGNIFLGDDGFGVEVVRRMAARPASPDVRVVDFGIRGMDLVYALLGDYDVIIFVDAAPRGELPGTVSLIESQMSEEREVSLDTHGMDPVKVLNLARELGAKTRRIYVVACEPELVLNGQDNPDVLMELSEPVLAAVDEAVQMVDSLVSEITTVCGTR